MTATTGALFELNDVTVVRDARTILAVEHLSLVEGRSTAIIGPSGSGKSTLLRLLNRLDVATSGTISYRNAPMLERNPLEHRRDVAMIFQRPTALEGTVLANLRVADPDIARDRADELLQRVGLPGVLDQEASSLSGGELQRASIARSLATDPTVLLLDEATSALDPENTLRIEGLVATLLGDGITPIWVTHNPAQMRRVADRVVVVIDGTIRHDGTAAEVLDSPDPEVAKFLGEAVP